MEVQLIQALNDLVNGRVYFDTSPNNPIFPLIILQQVGGRAYSYLEQKLPEYRHSRMQVHVSAKSRKEANMIARSAERRIIENIIPSEPIGAFSALHNETLGLYETRQDFGIWYKD